MRILVFLFAAIVVASAQRSEYIQLRPFMFAHPLNPVIPTLPAIQDRDQQTVEVPVQQTKPWNPTQRIYVLQPEDRVPFDPVPQAAVQQTKPFPVDGDAPVKQTKPWNPAQRIYVLQPEDRTSIDSVLQDIPSKQTKPFLVAGEPVKQTKPWNPANRIYVLQPGDRVPVQQETPQEQDFPIKQTKPAVAQEFPVQQTKPFPVAEGPVSQTKPFPVPEEPVKQTKPWSPANRIYVLQPEDRVPVQQETPQEQDFPIKQTKPAVAQEFPVQQTKPFPVAEGPVKQTKPFPVPEEPVKQTKPWSPANRIYVLQPEDLVPVQQETPQEQDFPIKQTKPAVAQEFPIQQTKPFPVAEGPVKQTKPFPVPEEPIKQTKPWNPANRIYVLQPGDRVPVQQETPQEQDVLVKQTKPFPVPEEPVQQTKPWNPAHRIYALQPGDRVPVQQENPQGPIKQTKPFPVTDPVPASVPVSGIYVLQPGDRIPLATAVPLGQASINETNESAILLDYPAKETKSCQGSPAVKPVTLPANLKPAIGQQRQNLGGNQEDRLGLGTQLFGPLIRTSALTSTVFTSYPVTITTGNFCWYTNAFIPLATCQNRKRRQAEDSDPEILIDGIPIQPSQIEKILQTEVPTLDSVVREDPSVESSKVEGSPEVRYPRAGLTVSTLATTITLTTPSFTSVSANATTSLFVAAGCIPRCFSTISMCPLL